MILLFLYEPYIKYFKFELQQRKQALSLKCKVYKIKNMKRKTTIVVIGKNIETDKN